MFDAHVPSKRTDHNTNSAALQLQRAVFWSHWHDQRTSVIRYNRIMQGVCRSSSSSDSWQGFCCRIAHDEILDQSSLEIQAVAFSLFYRLNPVLHGVTRRNCISLHHTQRCNIHWCSQRFHCPYGCQWIRQFLVHELEFKRHFLVDQIWHNWNQRVLATTCGPSKNWSHVFLKARKGRVKSYSANLQSRVARTDRQHFCR